MPTLTDRQLSAIAILISVSLEPVAVAARKIGVEANRLVAAPDPS